jgi:hypothetical protein
MYRFVSLSSLARLLRVLNLVQVQRESALKRAMSEWPSVILMSPTSQ